MAITAAQMRELMAAAPPAPAPKPAPAAAPPPPPPPPPPAAPATPSSFADEGRPTTQFIPPAGVTSSTAAMAAQSEDAKRHDEARRFARLLVSEIKLYNEPKVDAGRKNRDLYERLKEDIDRSRQMYDERIAEDVRKSSNYFYDELVRILAIICGAFMLRGHNWARWVAIAWIGFHVILSAFHSLGEFAMHCLFCAVFAWFLFRPDAARYFRIIR